MKRLKIKIIITIFDVVFLIGILGLSIRFFNALWVMDDEGMFVYGMCLMAITCTIIAIFLLASIIASIGKKE